MYEKNEVHFSHTKAKLLLGAGKTRCIFQRMNFNPFGRSDLRGSGKSRAGHGNPTINFGRDQDRTIEARDDLKLRDFCK